MMESQHKLYDENAKSPIFAHLGKFDSELSTKSLIKLFNNQKCFDFPKPLDLIKFLACQSTQEDDIILDFFAGSCTTAHAVMALNAEDEGNRKYICIQIPEEVDKKSEAYKAGYKTIADISKERIRRAAQKIQEEQRGSLGLQGKDKQDLGFKVFKLSHSPFKVWNTSPQEESLEQQVLEHTTSTKEDSEREDILYAILLHELGLELTIPIEKKTFAGKSVYSIEDDTMLICLEKEITQGVIDAMLEREPGYVIFLDDGFKGAYVKLLKVDNTKGIRVRVEIHQDKKGYKDTRGDTQLDEDTYGLIMRDKERLLDPSEPLRFIFSHSALREGWDNPNVFQICTLNESRSVEKKRQEIGRGLRLPVDKRGRRIFDETVNRLTIIANESYEDFASALQTEIEEDFGITFGKVSKIAFANIEWKAGKPLGQEESQNVWRALQREGYLEEDGTLTEAFSPDDPHFNLKIPDTYTDIEAHIIDRIKDFRFEGKHIVRARERKRLTFNKQVQLKPEFKELWDKIKQRTRYMVSFKTEELVKKAVAYMKNMGTILPVYYSWTRAEQKIEEAGVKSTIQAEGRTDITSTNALPDMIGYLQRETGLTRDTLMQIVKGSGRVEDFRKNPQAFLTQASHAITRALRKLIIKGIEYEKINGYWEMSRIEKDAEQGIVRYLNALYKVKHQEKSLFDYVEYESEVEKKFAHDLDTNEHVKLFVKLPTWFKVETPIGSYNPDWAFVTKKEKKLYFVRETKSTLDEEELRGRESQKIACGKKHFDTIGVDYDVVTNLKEVEF